MATVYGNFQGLKSNQIKQLERLYEQRLPDDRLITPEFAEQLSTLSQTIHHPICCYVNRRGQILQVGVGTPTQIHLSEADLPRRSGSRLSGIRCLVAQAQSPDSTALTAMLRQRLDALVVLTLADAKAGGGRSNQQNAIQQAYLAHIVPDVEQPWVVEPIDLDTLVDQDFDDRIHEWESEIQDAGFDISPRQTAQSSQDRALLVGLLTDDMPDPQFEDNLNELVRLVESARGALVDTVQQKRSTTIAAPNKKNRWQLNLKLLRAKFNSR
jgi:GTP-binding protein HflX